jgi:hypothetical protein
MWMRQVNYCPNLSVPSCMVRSFLMVASLSLLVGSAYPQETGRGQLPDAPGASTRPAPTAARQDAVAFHKKVFWTLVGVDAASSVADAQTSWHNEQMSPYLYEQNSWLYGRRPSLGRYYATDLVIDGGAAFLSYKLVHSRRRSLRVAGWILLAGAIAGHTQGWIYNVTAKQTILLPGPPGTR